MRDDELRPSGNIEDRRGLGGATKGGLGIGAILILALISWATGIDPRTLIGGAEMLSGGGSQQTTAPAREGVPSDATGTFVIAHEVGHHAEPDRAAAEGAACAGAGRRADR